MCSLERHPQLTFPLIFTPDTSVVPGGSFFCVGKSDGINEGEVPQYYVEDSHPAIIRPEEWEAVHAEITRRKSKGRRHDCGSVYGSKVWHSNDKYRRVIWQCNSKFKNETKCATPHVDEKNLKERFLRALSQYMADPEERIDGLRYV